MASEVAFADMVIALDVSGSVADDELDDLKVAANQIVDAFNLDSTDGRVRIGLLRFRGSSESVVGMTDVDDHGVSEPLHNGINGLQQGGPGLVSGTNIVAGLNGSKLQFDTGLGDRTDPPYPVPNLLVFITDSDDTAGNSDAAIKIASDGAGAEAFAIGVGGGVGMDTINAIATDPDVDRGFYHRRLQRPAGHIDDIAAAVYGVAALGSLFTNSAVSPDGTVVVSQILLPPT